MSYRLWGIPINQTNLLGVRGEVNIPCLHEVDPQSLTGVGELQFVCMKVQEVDLSEVAFPWNGCAWSTSRYWRCCPTDPSFLVTGTAIHKGRWHTSYTLLTIHSLVSIAENHDRLQLPWIFEALRLSMPRAQFLYLKCVMYVHLSIPHGLHTARYLRFHIQYRLESTILLPASTYEKNNQRVVIWKLAGPFVEIAPNTHPYKHFKGILPVVGYMNTLPLQRHLSDWTYEYESPMLIMCIRIARR